MQLVAFLNSVGSEKRSQASDYYNNNPPLSFLYISSHLPSLSIYFTVQKGICHTSCVLYQSVSWSPHRVSRLSEHIHLLRGTIIGQLKHARSLARVTGHPIIIQDTTTSCIYVPIFIYVMMRIEIYEYST